MTTLVYSPGHVSSPDGTEIAVIDGDRGGYLLRRFSLRDGTEWTEPVPLGRSWCPVTWVGSIPAVHLDGRPGLSQVALVVDGELHPVITMDPRIRSSCSRWAADALLGEAHGSVFGMRDAWWMWRWREIAAGLLFVALVGGLNVRRRWRRLH